MCEACEREQQGPSRRGLLAGVAAGAGLAVSAGALAAPQVEPPKPQNAISPDEALHRLMVGNARYVDGVTRRHDFAHEREALAAGQNPYAAVLGCADSRIAPEYAFDTARGDLFVCRVAGNFGSDEVVASLEYAVAVLNTPLIMVLGHGACGAVSSTIQSLKTGEVLPGHLPSLVAAIAPAVRASQGEPGDPLANAIRENVVLNVRALTHAGPILDSAVKAGKLRIVGGVYNLADGKVEQVA